ncbi:MAG TPA: transposase [candidate division Zixibacteria bacterium]|jgi:putative transposase|nr:transposase [candidate division Zixibacteria bacterium]
MTNYRRDKTPNGLYFFTLVTNGRIHVFENDKSISFLKSAIRNVKQQNPFKIEAIVILPEHLHLIMQLPEDDYNYSMRIAKIKKEFGKKYLKENSISIELSDSENKRNERGIWQRRFWEHRIKSHEDYLAHVNYIHYNPVKHNLVEHITEWKWSTYHKFFKSGFYDKDWGTKPVEEIKGVEWD